MRKRWLIGGLAAIILCLLVAVALLITPRVIAGTTHEPGRCGSWIMARSTGHVDDCIQGATQRSAKRDGIRRALGSLEEASLKSDVVRARCHLNMHVLGRAWRQRNASSGYDSFEAPKTSADCYGGFVHGYMQQAALSVKDPQEAITIAGSCVQTPLYARQACEHGIGHGFLRAGKFDLQESLDRCAWLDAEGRIANCSAGVLMDYQLARKRLDAAAPDKPLPPLERQCGQLDTRFHVACVEWSVWGTKTRQQVSEGCEPLNDGEAIRCRMQGLIQLPPDEIVAACETHESDAWREPCAFAHGLTTQLWARSERVAPERCSKRYEQEQGLLVRCANALGLARALMSVDSQLEPRKVCSDLTGNRQAFDACAAGISMASGPLEFL